MRASPEEYHGIPLRAHSLLAGVPLHDVWAVDLPRTRPGRTIVDLRALIAGKSLRTVNPAVRFLFALRFSLGRTFGWDRVPPEASQKSFLHQLTTTDRESSLVTPGTREGPFQILFVSQRESVAEVRNATVHGFSVFALVERSTDYRLYWAIYVLPVGLITSWYMRLIDPFRRVIIYPALLRHIEAVWSQAEAA